MTTTFEQAARAKETLRSKIGRPDWLRGIGIGQDEQGYFVKVNVKAVTPEIREQIPEHLGGVSIHLEAVGDITAAG